MEYLALNNGIHMPIIGFGTFILNGETCINSIANAIQAGYRMIDTAEAYGNEKEVGDGIKKSGIERKGRLHTWHMHHLDRETVAKCILNLLLLLFLINMKRPLHRFCS